MGSSVARTWGSMDLKSSACTPAPTARVSTQITTEAANTNSSHVPTGSLSVSKFVPIRANSIASSKTSVPTWSGYWKPQDHEVPRLTKTPWEVERYKRKSTWRRSSPETRLPAGMFKKIPREVYDCIVAQLEQIHLQKDQACPSCYLKDLHSL